MWTCVTSSFEDAYSPKQIHICIKTKWRRWSQNQNTFRFSIYNIIHPFSMRLHCYASLDVWPYLATPHVQYEHVCMSFPNLLHLTQGTWIVWSRTEESMITEGSFLIWGMGDELELSHIRDRRSIYQVESMFPWCSACCRCNLSWETSDPGNCKRCLGCGACCSLFLFPETNGPEYVARQNREICIFEFMSLWPCAEWAKLETSALYYHETRWQCHMPMCPPSVRYHACDLVGTWPSLLLWRRLRTRMTWEGAPFVCSCRSVLESHQF